ncbi:IS66 family transposase [Aquifex sp.]
MEGRKRVPAKVKAIAVVLYFNGMSFRKVSEVLKHITGVKVSPEAIRLWWHSLAKFLKTLYTLAMFVYVDETKIKARNKKYILWVATTRDGQQTFVLLSNKRNSHFTKLVLYSFPHNAKYETVWSWIAAFLFIKSFFPKT